MSHDETEEHLAVVRGTGDGFSWPYIAGNMYMKYLERNKTRYADGWKKKTT